ncbi:MAG: hypothetical protein A4E48_00215 [Methanosaeta sp. PtaU1.Bin060]|nr:MAG: hypothetical protein A4E48_00215 [Methanosaeta sp. PtaU1.Bin060]
MGYSFPAALVLALVMTSAIFQAQAAGDFQTVSGDFGRTWLKEFQSQNPATTQNSEGLWNWGGAPKGSIIQNGALVADPYYIWKSLNLTSGWMGQVYVDPDTGNPVYAFVDPYTGYPDYFYIDPKTGQPVYINSGIEGGSSIPPYSPYYGTPASSAYPWLGYPTDSPDYYGGLGMV